MHSTLKDIKSEEIKTPKMFNSCLMRNDGYGFTILTTGEGDSTGNISGVVVHTNKIHKIGYFSDCWSCSQLRELTEGSTLTITV